MQSIEIVKQSFARMCHRHWSDRLKNILSQCASTDCGDLIIPRELYKKWTIQANTPYQALDDYDKNKPKEEAREFMDLLGIE